MIARVKPTSDWSLSDWSTAIALVSLLVGGAWWMSAQNMLLIAVRQELQDVKALLAAAIAANDKENVSQWEQIRDNDRRIFVLETKAP
jgi:hypothetical protein